jgi:hypothetical protein
MLKEYTGTVCIHTYQSTEEELNKAQSLCPLYKEEELFLKEELSLANGKEKI